MAKWQNDAMLDAALSYITSNATEMYVCTTQPADRAGAIANALTGAIAPTFQALADGTPNGRELSVDAKSDQAITGDGDAQHIALCSGTTLLYVTTTTLQSLSNGGTVSIPAWKITVGDAA